MNELMTLLAVLLAALAIKEWSTPSAPVAKIE